MLWLAIIYLASVWDTSVFYSVYHCQSRFTIVILCTWLITVNFSTHRMKSNLFDNDEFPIPPCASTFLSLVHVRIAECYDPKQWFDFPLQILKNLVMLSFPYMFLLSEYRESYVAWSSSCMQCAISYENVAVGSLHLVNEKPRFLSVLPCIVRGYCACI